MTYPKNTPATSGSADQAVKSLTGFAEALETWCARGDINIPDRPKMARELRTVIQKAEQAAESKEAFELTKRLWLKQTDENISLRQRFRVLEGALEKIVWTPGNTNHREIAREALNQTRSGEK